MVEDIHQLSDDASEAVHKPCILSFQSFQGCNGLLFLNRDIGWLLEEAPAQRPELFGQCKELRIVFFCTARLDLPAVGEKRFFEVPPDILDRMEMVCLKSGMRTGVPAEPISRL